MPSVWPLQFALIHGPNIPSSYAILLFTASDLASITSHIHSWVLVLLLLLPFIPSGVISPLISSSILGSYHPGEFLFQYPIILSFQNVRGVLKARILKWFAIPFFNGPHSVRPLHHDSSILGGPTWHGLVSWVRHDCGPVIRLARFLWLWLQYVSPLMPTRNTYHFTWVSLTLDMGYLFTAALAKHSHCSLPWTRGISSQLPLLTLNLEWLPCGPHMPCAAAAPNLGRGVAPLVCSCAFATWHSLSLSLTLVRCNSSPTCFCTVLCSQHTSAKT